MNPYSNKVFSPAQFKHPEVPQGILSDIPSDSKNTFSVRLALPMIVLSIVLLIVCIVTLPLPARIDLALPGGRIDADGNLMQEGTIYLKGWQYHYLFRQDKMKVSVEVMDLTLSETNWQKKPYDSNTLGFFRHMIQSIYVSDLEEYQPSHICIAQDDSWFLIQIGHTLYFGSENPEMDAKAILEECRLVVN